MGLPLLYHRVEEQITFHDQDQTAILADLHLDTVLQTMAGPDPCAAGYLSGDPDSSVSQS